MKLSRFNLQCLALLSLLNGFAHAATVVWTNTTGGTWNAATNWTPNHIPGSDDYAVIALPEVATSLEVNLNANVTVGGLLLGSDSGCVAPRSLSVNGKSLTLNGPLTIGDCGRFIFDSGSLIGGTNAVITGQMTWSGGVLNGTLTLNTNSFLVLNGTAGQTYELYGGLTNFGTITLTSGDLDLQGNIIGRLYNMPGGLVDLQTNLTIYSYNNQGKIYNWGTFRKSAGTGTAVVRPFFFNYGQVDAQNGAVSFLGGGALNDGSSLGGAGSVQLSAGTFTFSGAVTGSNTVLSGAMLTGTSGVLSGDWKWADGYFAGGSTLTVATNGRLTLAGITGQEYTLFGILTNAGVVKLQSGNLQLQGNLQGLLINLPGALVDLTTDLNVYDYNNHGAVINWGTFRKSGGFGVSSVRATLYNHGTLDVQTGTANYFGPTTLLDDGSLITGAGINQVSGPAVTLNGSITSENLVLASPAILGTNSISGQVSWTAGVLNSSAGMTVATNGLLRLSGTDQKVILGLLSNLGTIQLADSGIIAMGTYSTPAIINNQPGALFEALGDAPIRWTGYLQPFFTNAGTIRKSGSTGTTVIDGVLFQNSGTIDVQSGTVLFVTGGSLFTDGTRFIGTGTNLLASGNNPIVLNGSIESANLELGLGWISGNCTLHGITRWTRALVTDGASLTIAPGAVLQLTGEAEKASVGAIDNFGTITFSGSGRLAMASQSGHGFLVNRLGALFETDSDAPIVHTALNDPPFTNAGTFRKTVSNGTTVIDGVPFYNTGTLDVQTGTVLYSAPGSIFGDGSRFIGKGTNLLASSGAIRLSGSIYSDNLELGSTHIFGNATLRGTVNWTKAVVDDGTVLNIASDGLVAMTGPDDKANLGVLDNNGTILLAGGRLAMGSLTSPATVINRPTALFDVSGDSSIAWTGLSIPGFTNAGIFRKSSGTGTTVIDLIPFANTGTIDTRSGTVAFNASGTLFDNGTRFIGSGTNLLYAGNISLNGNVYSENLLIKGATILGTSKLDGVARWTSGALASSAFFTVNTNAALLLSGPDEKSIVGALNNLGTVQLTGEGRLALGTQTGQPVLQNQPGALFDILGEPSIAWAAFGQAAMTNAGTFRKSAGTNIAVLNGINLQNSGTLEVQSGTLGYNGPNTTFYEGTRFIGSGTNWLAGSDTTVAGSIYSENLLIAGANLLGDSKLNGLVQWISGAILSPTVVTIAPNSTLKFSGSDQKVIIGVLNNQGHIVFAGEGRLAMGSDKSLAYVYNEPGALFEVSGSAPIAWTGYSEPFFTNGGTFRTTGGPASTPSITVGFINSGTVEAQSGTLTLAGTSDLSGGKLNFGLSNATNFGRINFAAATLTGSVGAECLNGYQPITGTSFPVLGYASRTGQFEKYAFPSCAAWQTNYDVTSFSLFVLNARPSIDPVADQQIDELKTLHVSNSASHPDGALQTLSFRLESSPAGMTINPGSGLITWTPAQTQSPSTNFVSVVVTDSGTPPLSSTNSFLAIVREVNMAPALPLLSAQTVDELTLLRLTNSAAEPNIHSTTIGYALLQSPTGAVISAQGIITWTPSQQQSPSTNVFITIVTNANPFDAVNPNLTASNAVTIIVREVNVAPVLPTIPPQGVYELSRLTVTNGATESNIHSSSGYRLESAPAGMSIDATGVISWIPNHDQAGTTNLVLTVVTNFNPFDPVNPSLSATNQFSVIVYPRPVLAISRDPANGDVLITFMTVVGENYTVQYSTDLADWMSKASLDGFGGPLTIRDTEYDTRPATYYRLEVKR